MKKLTTKEAAYIGVAAAIIAVCSWISIPVGTIPITLQTFAVCLVSAVLGLKCGTLATVIYILLGAVGVPVFSGFKGGVGVLFGATGGYILGFVLTAAIVGCVSDRAGQKLWALLLSMLLGVAVCYAVGTAWFSLVYSAEQPTRILSKALALCVTPFVIPDAIKIITASIIAARLKKFIK